MNREIYENLKEVETRHWWFRGRRKVILDRIRSLSPKPKMRILEAGCGTGGNFKLLSTFGSVKAFEIDDDSVAYAQSLELADVERGYLPEANPFEDDSFDLIVAFDVLEHIEPHREAVEDLLKCIGPNGKFLITVPALPALWSYHDEQHQHFRRYTKKTLRQTLEENGWEVQKISYYNFFLFPLAYVARKLNPKGSSEKADLKVPMGLVNFIFTKILHLESFLIKFMSLPIGLSLVCIAQPKTK
ncbi:MAG: class I SAM-dependent methyltransferase [Symploca sp. SIO2D2]|nr:class I SAM-dependent methyltransferase [Symploca sp. SIO2D2]